MIYKNALINGKLCDITVENGVIKSLEKNNFRGEDLNGCEVFCGLIDIHSHGCCGYDTMDGDKFGEMAKEYAKNGVTTWYPTTMTMDKESLKRICNFDISSVKCVNIPGFHFEGPFINEKFKGAQNKKFIRKPDLEEMNEYRNVKIVTLAPELEGAMDFIKKYDAVCCLGHTDCDFNTAVESFEKGALCLTHTFNAMNGIHHRKPGPIGAAFEKNAYVQVICDGLHIHRSVVKMLFKLFTKERMILISDSMRATGLKDGVYEFGGQSITVKNSEARTADGNLAGSTSSLLKCVKKAIEFGIDKQDAFYMASKTPAQLMGLNKGELSEGFDADFIVCDKNLNVLKTIVKGEVVYEV